MKLYVLVLALITGSVAEAKIVCMDESSRLVLEKTDFIWDVEGVYEYNRSDDGEYSSVVVLGCRFKKDMNGAEVLDCEETTYGVLYSIYKISRDMLTRTTKNIFSITELERDENSGEITGETVHNRCEYE